jgi:hypothetical protein
MNLLSRETTPTGTAARNPPEIVAFPALDANQRSWDLCPDS